MAYTSRAATAAATTMDTSGGQPSRTVPMAEPYAPIAAKAAWASENCPA
ncbi:hypothetical protein ACFSTC_42470 [Nonomuraea ferruginea]